jgi:hypothetical protein
MEIDLQPLFEALAQRVAQIVVSQLRKGEQREADGPWPEIMDLKTAARYMDRNYDSVWLKVKKQEIPAVWDGGRKFLRRVDIDKWAEKNLV